MGSPSFVSMLFGLTAVFVFPAIKTPDPNLDPNAERGREERREW